MREREIKENKRRQFFDARLKPFLGVCPWPDLVNKSFYKWAVFVGLSPGVLIKGK